MTTTRRDFLVQIGATTAASACAGLLPACVGPPEEGDVDGGNVSELAEGDLKPVASSGVIVGRDAGGVYALTAICTHLACDISDPNGGHSVDGSGIRCSCHGSQFDLDGNVTAGPATQPLRHWETIVDDAGAITVRVGIEVPAETRVAVAAA